MRRPESYCDKLWRYRGVLLVASIPVILILVIVAMIPRTPPNSYQQPITLPPKDANGTAVQSNGGIRYNIVLDAGSTGSRIHVFKFEDTNGALSLVSDTFKQLKPGLSSYADEPQKAAESLKDLLDLAVSTVSKDLQAATGISLRATAGLRLLPGGKADAILDAVREYLKKYPFQLKPDGVSILDGQGEGGYAWMTLNYLLGNLGKAPSDTVAAIDLGGGSVQEAFALSDEDAAKAPDGYIVKLRASGKSYNVYVHSYLGYGLMAARAKMIDGGKGAESHPCFHKGHEGSYTYADKKYDVKALAAAGTFDGCTSVASLALELAKECGKEAEACSFAGGWRGKFDDTKRIYYVSSYFWDRAQDSGIISKDDAIDWKVSPNDFANKAREVCGKNLEDITKLYPAVKSDAAPYFCLDLSFCHTLLTKGFKVPADQKITLVKQVKYRDQNIEAAWPLGAAINDLS